MELVKLNKLLNSCLAEEQNALLAKKEVEQIAEQRTQDLDKVNNQLMILERKIDNLENEQRELALSQGDISKLHSIENYIERLKKEKINFLKEKNSKEEDLNRALERVNLLNDEWIQSRVERKKIEKIISQREEANRVASAAKDDSYNDEHNIIRYTKKKD